MEPLSLGNLASNRPHPFDAMPSYRPIEPLSLGNISSIKPTEPHNYGKASSKKYIQQRNLSPSQGQAQQPRRTMMTSKYCQPFPSIQHDQGRSKY